MPITEYAAGRMIAHADALVHRYPAVLDSLGGGRMTPQHAESGGGGGCGWSRSSATQLLVPGIALAESRAVGHVPARAARAGRDGAGGDARGTAPGGRADAARGGRARRRRHGAAAAYGPAVELHAIFGRATAIAKTLAAADGETRTLDQLRADVFCDLLIDGITDHLPAEARGIRATVVVTVPVLALLDDQTAATRGPAGGGGIGPIPLSRARELCGGDDRWMRVLTHPETGMVLSVGRDHYRPPPSCASSTKWRADRCMAPGCGMPASRCEIDHNIAWEDGGHTSLENHAPFCKGHHIVKTPRRLDRRTDPTTAAARSNGPHPPAGTYTVDPERRVPVFRHTTPLPGDASDAPF